jgi:hypothetical protein
MSSKQVKAPTKTLNNISETTKTYETTENPMLIRSPYKEWDPDRIFISAPDKRESNDKKASFFECIIQYNYKLPDGTEMKGPLLIEFPHEDGRHCISHYGISEIMEKVDEKDKQQDSAVERKGTGKFQIFCQLDPRFEQSIELAGLLNDIYDKALSYMEDHGKEGSGMLGDKKYSKPKDTIDESNTADHLRYPVWYKDSTFIDSSGRKKTVKDTKVPFTIVLSVAVSGRRATKFCDDTATVIKHSDLLGTGMEHIPLMHVSSIFVGGTGNKLRLGADSSIVVKKLPPAILHQGSTIKERLNSGKSTAAAEMAKLAGEVFAKDGLNTNTTSDTAKPETEEFDAEKGDGENSHTNEEKLQETTSEQKSNSADRVSPNRRNRSPRGTQQSPERQRVNNDDNRSSTTSKKPTLSNVAPRRAGQRPVS